MDCGGEHEKHVRSARQQFSKDFVPRGDSLSTRSGKVINEDDGVVRGKVLPWQIGSIDKQVIEPFPGQPSCETKGVEHSVAALP